MPPCGQAGWPMTGMTPGWHLPNRKPWKPRDGR
nr:MAG TPA: hypothetical protein [Caudoviricetes sp.]